MPERTTDAAASELETPTPETEAPVDVPTVAARPHEVEAAEGPTPGDDEAATSATPSGQMPEYKGEPLDAERGPGLGCFWIQIGLLTFFLVLTPLTVTWGWDPTISAILLILTLILLLFSGQTIIFLLRLVAADRRSRRTPLSTTAKPTVGQMEDAAPEDAAAGATSQTATPAPPATEASAAGADPPTEPSEEKPADG